jgi:hypothetical protein
VRGWDSSFLLATVFVGALGVVLAELLGIFRALKANHLALSWLVVDLVLAIAVTLSWCGRDAPRFRWPRRVSGVQSAFLAVLGAYLLVLALVGLASPPNNVDSLQYHMARVAHWSQQGSLEHYGTAYGPQLWNPPAAEILILNLSLLAGTDQAANLVQWFAYLASLVAVWWAGGVLELRTEARWLGIAFMASIPMAVLQATSTQNDLIAGYWLVVVAALVAADVRRGLTATEIGALGLALGLGLLTKATFYFFCAPFVLWAVVARRQGPDGWRGVRELGLAALIALGLNVGHLARNVGQGWTPFGPVDSLPVPIREAISSRPIVSALLRPVGALTLNFATPSPEANARMVEAYTLISSAVGADEAEAVLVWDWNHEEAAGSPIHVLVLLATGLLTLTPPRQKLWLVFAVCLMLGYVLLPLATPLAVEPANVRYQLPILMTGSLLVAHSLARRITRLEPINLVLLLLAIPWVVSNKARPVLAMRPDPGPGELPCIAGCTAIGSVFTTPKPDILLANRRELLEPYLGVSQALRSRDCRAIGLRIDSHDPEYAFWYMLRTREEEYRMESIYTSPGLEPLLDRTFQPCAIICTICGNRSRLHGLNIHSAWENVGLFLGDGFTWDEDG